MVAVGEGEIGMIIHRSIYPLDGGEPSKADLDFLYDQLAERDETVNISHQTMPTFEKHVEFVQSRPYRDWWVIEVDGDPVGHIYLSKKSEIGIFLLKTHQGFGLGPAAIAALMKLFPDEPLFANVNPKNARSRAIFESLGFRLIQETYRIR
jgi:RimJ/RimL family protein N-acetyltransferase